MLVLYLMTFSKKIALNPQVMALNVWNSILINWFLEGL